MHAINSVFALPHVITNEMIVLFRCAIFDVLIHIFYLDAKYIFQSDNNNNKTYVPAGVGNRLLGMIYPFVFLII
jgi:hypothetical protein